MRLFAISDIHVGPTIKGPYLDHIVDRVNSLKPDAVAITGDLVDGTVRELSAHTAPLARLQARHGSYFVTGNHEYYAGAQPWIDELRRLGLCVLMNEHVVVQHGGQPLVLAGVTDYSAGRFHESHRSDPHRAIVAGPSRLRGSSMTSPDIRAGMAMLLAAVCAEGTSTINNADQIERGYERIEERLNALGAKITRVPERSRA